MVLTKREMDTSIVVVTQVRFLQLYPSINSASMRFVLAVILVLATLSTQAQTGGYKISFKIKSWKDTTVYLGSYVGTTNVLMDTAQVKSGAFTFDGKKALPQGEYYLVLAKNKLFDFVIGPNQFFSIETHSSGYLAIDEYIENLVVHNDQDNQIFFDNIKYNIARHKEAEPYIKTLRDSTLKDDQKKEAREAYSKINDKVMEHQREVMEKYPTLLTARMMKAYTPIKIPDPPKKADGTIDSSFQFKYYRQHFFDNIDLGDEAMIHLQQSLYQDKVKEYLTKLFFQQPDTVTKAIVELAARAKRNTDTYRFFVWTCLFHYQQPEIMGMDEVCVNVYDKYFATGEMDYWANGKLKESVKEYVDKIRTCRLGQKGNDLIMQDQNKQRRALYDVRAKYTIVYFFRPSCGHCREETPKLVEFYNKNKQKYNLEVFAVATDTAMAEMRDFIKEFKTPWITVNGPRTYQKELFNKLYHADTTPTIFILDDKKTIIAKKLPIKQIDDFLTKHEKMQQLRKSKEGQAKSTPGGGQ